MTSASWKQAWLVRLGTLILAGAALCAQTVPSQLGVSANEAQGYLLDSLSQGWLSYGGAARAFVALPTDARVTVVKAGFAWARAYVDSPAFKAAYDKRRDTQKPEPPTFNGTVDDEVTKKLDDTKKKLADSRASLAALPADQRAQLETFFKQTEAQLNDPQYLSLMRKSVEADRAKGQQQYQSSLDDWQKNYPADPKLLLARRLATFLTKTADIDFSAKTTGTGKSTRFVDPACESKPSDWKMAFRAGKESVDTARAAVTEWLKVLPKP